MKALSVRAPWWYAIFHLGKDIENRGRYVGFRGTLYIHASKWWSTEGVRDEWEWGVAPRKAEADPGRVRPAITPAIAGTLKAVGGCLVSKVDVVGCVMNHPSPWFVGKFGIVLANPVLLAQPIPFKGALGLFEVPDDIEDGLARERTDTRLMYGTKLAATREGGAADAT